MPVNASGWPISRARTGLSPSHLQRSFKAAVGVDAQAVPGDMPVASIQTESEEGQGGCGCRIRCGLRLSQPGLRAGGHGARHDARTVQPGRTRARDLLRGDRYSGGPAHGRRYSTRPLLRSVRRLRRGAARHASQGVSGSRTAADGGRRARIARLDRGGVRTSRRRLAASGLARRTCAPRPFRLRSGDICRRCGPAIPDPTRRWRRPWAGRARPEPWRGPAPQTSWPWSSPATACFAATETWAVSNGAWKEKRRFWRLRLNIRVKKSDKRGMTAAAPALIVWKDSYSVRIPKIDQAYARELGV